MGRDRGQSVSLLVLLVVPALILVLGLVVDGGQKARNVARAESVAAGAARAAGNAAAVSQVAGRVDSGAALAAARDFLAGSGVPGTATYADGQITVTATVTTPAVVLSVVGYDNVPGQGSATAEIVPVASR